MGASFRDSFTHDGTHLPCLSVCQPYAERIIRGTKPVENRTWKTGYRGPLLIHAGVSKKWFSAGDAEDPRELPFGAIVGQVELVDCVRAGDLWKAHPIAYALSEHHGGDNGGPWCWVVRNHRRLKKPIPLRGQLGLFAVPTDCFSTLCAATP